MFLCLLPWKFFLNSAEIITLHTSLMPCPLGKEEWKVTWPLKENLLVRYHGTALFFSPNIFIQGFNSDRSIKLLMILICVISISRKYLISTIFVSLRIFYRTFPAQEELIFLWMNSLNLFTRQLSNHSNSLAISWHHRKHLASPHSDASQLYKSFYVTFCLNSFVCNPIILSHMTAICLTYHKPQCAHQTFTSLEIQAAQAQHLSPIKLANCRIIRNDN